jgi:hypothetical protein
MCVVTHRFGVFVTRAVEEDSVVDPGEYSRGPLLVEELPHRIASTTASTPTRLSALTGLRIGWGAALIAAPRPLLRGLACVNDPADRVAVAVLRVLGARHVAQAAFEVLAPQPVVRYLGAAVDGLHALTAVGLAVLDPRWRRGALTDTAIAAFFAAMAAIRTGRGSKGLHR